MRNEDGTSQTVNLIGRSYDTSHKLSKYQEEPPEPQQRNESPQYYGGDNYEGDFAGAKIEGNDHQFVTGEKHTIINANKEGAVIVKKYYGNDYSESD